MFTKCSLAHFSLCLLLAGFFGTLFSACHKSADGSEEVCNYLDDDWSGMADDPFINEFGIYFTPEHCGACNVNCDEIYPDAAATSCVSIENPSSPAICVITACPEGEHLVGTSFCSPDTNVLCLPCEDDSDCSIWDPSALCLSLENGDRRCGMNCVESAFACPDGFECNEDTAQCVPKSGSCECTPEQAETVLSCLIESPDDGHLCPGSQTCDGDFLTECEPLIEEYCDATDNNCDGITDEGFLEDGLYIHNDHCGGCNQPCVAPADNMSAECVLESSSPSCLYACMEGFVDLDEVAINGCECEMTAAVWPPSVHGTDGDCDGNLDDMSSFIYVSKDGDDSNPGTIYSPVLTISQGIILATPASKTLFVSQGVYEETVTIEPGVSMFGGYRSDFGARDSDIFEVTITNDSTETGQPCLRADGVSVPTEISGFTVKGTDALIPGGASTAVYLANSGPSLVLKEMKVISGRGSDGADGISSSVLLSNAGVPALSLLDGILGQDGQVGFDAFTIDCYGQSGSGGSGGYKVCPLGSNNISGGDGGDSSCPATGCIIGSPCGNAGCSDFMVADECDTEAMYAAAAPNPPAEDGQGSGGGQAGNITYDAPTTIPGSSFCDDNPTLRREGGNGQDGDPGTDGLGGQGFSEDSGNFDLLTGLWTGGEGTDGSDGTSGSGGGGGTQGNGYDHISGSGSPYYDNLGGAGGGGGSGGCEAPGATRGKGGGGSVGVVVILPYDAVGPDISNLRIIPAQAGDGGDGGVGAAGGMPGTGGMGGDGNFWCARRGGKGGDGGRGGAGGGGGGGSGGSISGFHVVPHPIGWADPGAYLLDLIDANSVDPLPTPGSGGSGGYSPGYSGSAGVPGSAVAFRIYSMD